MRCRLEFILALVTLFSVSYCYQGGGWNQHTRFNTIRAIVERGTAEITEFAGNTGDISRIGDRIYSDKAPGIALLGVPPYYLLLKIEQAFGYTAESLLLANIYILTVLLSGLPSVILGVLLYRYSRSIGVSERASALIAFISVHCTLLLPYSGVLMSHNLVAMLLFACFYLLRKQTCRPGEVALAGLLGGWAVVVEYQSAVPVAAIFVVFYRSVITQFVFALGGAVVSIATLVSYNYLVFGRMLTMSYAHQDPRFHKEGRVLGLFDLPDLERLYWMLLHPHKGLLIWCPLLLLLVVAWRRSSRLQQAARDRLAAILIVLCYLLLVSSMPGWSGGWGIGPRYLIPIIPFAIVLLYRPLLRFSKLSTALSLISYASMSIATIVWVQFPAALLDAPERSQFPLGTLLSLLLCNSVSVHTQSVTTFEIHTISVCGKSAHADLNSFNLGELIGLQGASSALPFVLAHLLFVGFVIAYSANKPVKTP